MFPFRPVELPLMLLTALTLAACAHDEHHHHHPDKTANRFTHRPSPLYSYHQDGDEVSEQEFFYGSWAHKSVDAESKFFYDSWR